jgi:hypothetical protein
MPQRDDGVQFGIHRPRCLYASTESCTWVYLRDAIYPARTRRALSMLDVGSWRRRWKSRGQSRSLVCVKERR